MIKTYYRHSRMKITVRSVSRMFFANFKRRKILIFSLISLLIILPISLIVLNNRSTVEAAWMDDAWLFRKAISIPTHTTLETNVYVTVPAFDATDTSKFQADCGDLRFTKQNGEQLPYYVVDCDATANIHVLFDSLPAGASTYYMYYGNPSVANGFSSADFATAATGLGSQTLAAEEKSLGPVSYWKFDEGQGAATKDSTSNGNAGTITGATWATEDQCISGKCLYFNGTNAVVNLGSLPTITAPYTVSFWFKPQKLSANQVVLSLKGAGTYPVFYLLSNNKLLSYAGAEKYRYGSKVFTSTDLNQWQFVTMIVNDSSSLTNWKVYLNGQDNTGSPGANTGAYNEPSTSGSIGNTFQGYIDDVKIYPYARTAAQIKSDFATKGSGSVKGTSVSMGSNSKNNDALSNGLVSYWKSDEASGNGADSSGNSNTTTVSGSNNYGTGKFGNGLRSGVATTNLIANPSFETNTTGWNFQAGGGSGSFAADSTTSVVGSKSGKLSVATAASNYPRVFFSQGTLTDGVTYTISWYGKADSAGSTLRTDLENSSNGVNCASAGTTYITPTYTTSWTRYSYSFTFSSTNCPTTSPILMFQYPAVQNYYFDGFQIEASTTSTPYTDGSLGTGYSWSGTAHASTSTRTASTATNATLLNNTSGSLSFWFNSPSLDTSAQCPLGATNGDSTGGLFFGLKSTGVYLTHNYATSQTVTPQYVATIANNTWNHVVYTWDNAALKGNLYVNGALQQNVSYSQAITIGEYIQNLGTCTRTGYTTFNGTIDDVRDYNRALSGAEVSKLYAWAPGPVGYWNFEEGTGGYAQDISGNGNQGTWSGTGTHWVTGKYGKASNFTNGSSDYITVTDNTPLRFGTGNFTVETWIKFPINGHPTNGWDGVVTKGFTTSAPANTWGLVRTSTGTNRVSFYDSVDAGGSFNANLASSTFSNGWHHIAVTRSGTTYSIYSDGTLTTSGIYAVANLSTTASLLIGQEGGRYLTGSLDDVRIYNYPRTSGQITEDMNAGHPLGGSPVGSQVAYYKFDEGYGDTANNSGNGGSVINGNLAGTCPGDATCPTWSNSGKSGKALDFERDNSQEISVTNSLTSDYITVSAWINPESWESSGYNGIVSSNSRFGLRNVNGNMQFAVYTTAWNNGHAGFSSSTYLPIGQWSYVAATYDGTNIKVYVNGRLTDTDAAVYPGVIAANWGTINIGEDVSNGRNFDGLIDEVKIYNAALTADEIKLDYNRGSAMVLGTMSDTSGLSGGSIASSSASAAYCIPGDTATCNPPVGEWNFEEGSGNTTSDNSGNGYIGTWAGTLGNQWKQGKIGKAGNFNGSDNYISVGNQTNLNFATGDFSIGSWFKSSNSSGFQRIMSKKSGSTASIGYAIGILQTTGYIYFNIGDGTNYRQITSTSSVVDGNWHYAEATWTGSSDTALLYVDGKLIGTGTGVGTVGTITTSDSFEIGDVSSNAGAYMNGQIDQVRIFNYARTPAQVAWDYNQGKPVGWWKLDECQGVTANDSSGNGNSGTITIGATGTQTSAGTCTDGLSTSAWNNGKTGKFNSSLNFDGTNDAVTVPVADGTILDLDVNPITLAAWVKLSALNVYQRIVFKGINGSSGYGMSFNVNTNSKFNCGNAGGGNFDSNTVAVTGQWYHVVCEINGSSSQIYINGALQTTGTVNAVANSGTALSIGADGGGTGSFLNGQIDDVRVYNYALTPVQIKQVYNNGAINFGPATGSP